MPEPAATGVPTADSPVTLREITAETVRMICNLSVTPDQERFVSPNAVSIAEAYFSPDRAWFRAIYAGVIPVGFVMLDEQPDKGEYFLWRFMMDARYQGLGFGARALDLVIERVKGLPGATALETSVVEGEGSPQGFYERRGFALTGDYEEDEAVMRLDLS